MKTNGNKIGVFTTFGSWDEAYSLTTIVKAQIEMIKKSGNTPVFIGLDIFKDDIGCEVRTVPTITYKNYEPGEDISEEHKEEIPKIKDALEEAIKDLDVVLTHDIILQSAFVPYNLAMRQVKGNFIHFIHSVPANLYEPSCPEGSTIVSLNNTDKLRVAEAFQTTMENIAVVYNPMDIRDYYEVDPITREIVDKLGLLDYDTINIYPFCTTRMDAKGVEKVIKLNKHLNYVRKTKTLLINSHANAEREKDLVESKQEWADKYGADVQFTSLLGYPNGLPHKVVKDLFKLSDLFIFPSKSEFCSLVQLEAGLGKNLMVLNDDFEPMREISIGLNMGFGSMRQARNYSDENAYYKDWSRIINWEINQDKTLTNFIKMRKEFNQDYIWEQQLYPLILKYEKNN